MFSFALLSLLISPASAIPLSGAPANALVISEIMHNPDAVVDYRGEYIEIHNRHSQEIDLNGLTVVSSNEAGFTINTSVTVAAGGYVVLGTRSNSAVNGGASVDYQYNYGTFKLYNNETISISDGGTTFDTVVYSASTYQLEAGVALILQLDD